MEMDVIRLIDKHLVVNLREFITPKTHHLTARAKRNLSSCCIGIQYIDKKHSHGSPVACTLDMLLQATGFLENTEAVDGEESWLSLSTIKQYRQKEDKEKTLKTVTAISIGLHLHPYLREAAWNT